MSNVFRAMLVAASIPLVLAACGGGGGSDGPQTGLLSIGVTDAPVDSAAKVVVRFTAIELKPEGKNPVTIDLNPDKTLDVLALAGGKVEPLLDGHTVDAGRYEWVRLMIAAEQNTQDGSYIELTTGERFPLYIPSGSESGLKLIRGFTVAVGGRTNFTIDFDLRKSVIAPPGQAPNYILKPVLRIVDNLKVGTISGTVPVGLIPSGCTPFIYIFSGLNVTPDDLDAAAAPDVDPFVSVPIVLDSATGQYSFRVPFLEAGDYTVSFTCDGAKDTPEGEETLNFVGNFNVQLTANQTANLSF